MNDDIVSRIDRLTQPARDLLDALQKRALLGWAHLNGETVSADAWRASEEEIRAAELAVVRMRAERRLNFADLNAAGPQKC